MDNIIENYIIIPGFIGLIFIVIFKIYTFNTYAKIKRKTDPDFNPLEFQGWVGNVFFMTPHKIQSKHEASPDLKKLAERHNALLKLLIVYMVCLCLIVILLSIVNSIFF